MPRTLLVEPLISDALGGEFHPATDPERAHTLARLMVATHKKGELVEEGRYTETLYTPSWAQGVETRVETRVLDRNYAVLSRLDLSVPADEDTSLSIYTGPDSIVIDDREYVLELGRNLAIARQAGIEAASAFFRSAAAQR